MINSRKKRKQLISLASAICLLAEMGGGQVFAKSESPKLFDVDVSYDAARNSMVFSGTMANKKTEMVNIAVAEYGVDVTDFATDASEEIILKTNKTNGSGDIDVAIEIPDNIKSNQRNTYHIFGNDTGKIGIIFTLERDALNDVLGAINSGSGESVEKIKTSSLNDGEVGLDSDSITKIAEFIIKAKPSDGYTQESLIAKYLIAEGFMRVKNGLISTDAYFDEYNVYIGKELWKRYDELSDDTKKAFDTSIKNYKLGENTDITKIYNELDFVSGCICAVSAADMKNKIVEYFKNNGIDLTYYNALPNETRREAAIDAVYKERATIKTLSDVISLLKAKVGAEAQRAQDIENDKNTPSSPSIIGGDRVTSSTGNNASIFNDMANHWASEYVTKLKQKNVINGFPDGSFRPDNSITRAEFAKIVVSVLGIKNNGDVEYADVAKDSWYYDCVAAATEAKLINGTDSGFLPENNITRQDAVVIIARALEYKNVTLPTPGVEFSDMNSVSDYAVSAVKGLSELGIVGGDNGKFRPLDSLTRAETATLFVKFYDFMDGKPLDKETSNAQVDSKDVSADSEKSADVAAGNEIKETFEYRKAKSILDVLSGDEVFFDENSDGVTRGEFLHALLYLTKKDFKGKATQIFEDVPADHKYAIDASNAVDLDMIDEAGLFRPDDKITMSEASKLMVSVLGYSSIAEYRGGYPMGYIDVAQTLGFMENVKVDSENISGENAALIFYNLLNQNVGTVSYSGNKPTITLDKEDSSLFVKLYKIYNIDGVVTAVGNHSLNIDANKRDDYVEIDGIGYELEGVSPNMLGKKVTAFISEKSNKELLCIVENNNTEISLAAKDFDSFSGNTFKYKEGTKTKSIKMDGAYKVIYNGRRISAWDESMAENDFAKLRFVDNNDDDIYEILFVDTYSYGILSGVDYKNLEVGIKFEKRTLNLDLDDSVVEIFNAYGESVDLFRLESGMCVAIKESDDKKYYEIRVCDKKINGTIEKINTSDNEITIDNVVYGCSPYFINKYILTRGIMAGQKVSINLGMDNEAVELLDNTNISMSYAYLINVIPSADAGTKKAKLRLYTIDGSIKVIDISDKTEIDGADRINGDKVYDQLIATSLPYLIRYGVNADGEINVIDLPGEAGDDITETLDPKNSLRKNYERQSLLYRSGCTGFNSYALLKGSMVMFVPEKAEYLKDESKYQIGTSSLLTSNAKYSVELYDIDENGNAGLALVFDDWSTDPTKSLRAGYIVSGVSECVKDDEVMLRIDCYGNKGFAIFYLPEDAEIKKTSGTGLVPGDIIRLKLKDDIIQCAYVDFDYSSGVMTHDTAGGSTFGDRTCNGSLAFLSGKVYGINGGNLVISNTVKTNGEYSFQTKDLLPYSLGGAEIVMFDTATNTITPIDAGLIHDYLGYGADADFMIMRQDGASMKNLYIIR